MPRVARLAALVALALSLAPVAFAQQQLPPAVANSTPEERAKVQTLVMQQKLALTPEQLPKVEAINLQIAQKMEPVIKGNERPILKLAAMKQAEGERESALAGVLTPAQMQQYQAARDEIKQKAEQQLMAKKAGGGAP